MATESGLHAPAEGAFRYDIVCIHNATSELDGKGLIAMMNKDAKGIYNILEKNDVQVTNQKDKEKLLPKVLEMDSHVSKMFSTPVATTVT